MLSRVIGQDSAKQQLITAYSNQRLAHAYLIAGEEGLGAEELAIEAAKYFLCSNKDSKSFEPCQNCSSCKKISSFQHPDVHYYFPKLKSTEDEVLRSMLEAKAEELYHKVKIQGGTLHIGDPENPEDNSVRGLLGEIGLRSYEGNMKIFIVTFIEEMNAEATNAMLKVLEEPPASTLYFLTTSQVHAVLPTILSRCQTIKLHPLNTRQIQLALQKSRNMNDNESHLIAKLSNGNYATALQLVSGDLSKKRDFMLEFLVAVVSPQSNAIAITVDHLAGEFKKDKGFLIEMLTLMMAWFQDLFYMKHLNGHSDILNINLINQDRKDRLEKFVRNFPHADVDSALFEIEKAVDLISRNVYLNLVLINLGLNLQKLILSKQ
jgi:DNA polymerase-3 subunit delta'